MTSASYFFLISPLADPLRLFLIQLIIILLLVRVISKIFYFFRSSHPMVMSEILAGMLLGPTALGAIPSFSAYLFPPSSLSSLQIVSNVAVIFFLFFLGVEVDLPSMRRKMNSAAPIAAMAIIIPLICGIALSSLLYSIDANDSSNPTQTTSLIYSLFIGTSFSFSAFPVLARILTSTSLLNQPIGEHTIAIAAIDDLMAWITLAAALSYASGGNVVGGVYTLLAAIVMVLIMIFPIRWILHFYHEKLLAKNDEMNRNFLVILFVLLMLSSITADWIGIHAFFGSFICGCIVPKNGQLGEQLSHRLELLIVDFFLPIYFAVSGIQTDLTSINTWEMAGITVLVIVVGSLAKILPVALTMRWISTKGNDELDMTKEEMEMEREEEIIRKFFERKDFKMHGNGDGNRKGQEGDNGEDKEMTNILIPPTPANSPENSLARQLRSPISIDDDVILHHNNPLYSHAHSPPSPAGVNWSFFDPSVYVIGIGTQTARRMVENSSTLDPTTLMTGSGSDCEWGSNRRSGSDGISEKEKESGSREAKQRESDSDTNGTPNPHQVEVENHNDKEREQRKEERPDPSSSSSSYPIILPHHDKEKLEDVVLEPFLSSSPYSSSQVVVSSLSPELLVPSAVSIPPPSSSLRRSIRSLSWRACFSIGFLMNTRGLVALIVLNIGLQKGILGKHSFAIMILMALVTTFMTPPLLHFFYSDQYFQRKEHIHQFNMMRNHMENMKKKKAIGTMAEESENENQTENDMADVNGEKEMQKAEEEQREKYQQHMSPLVTPIHSPSRLSDINAKGKMKFNDNNRHDNHPGNDMGNNSQNNNNETNSANPPHSPPHIPVNAMNRNNKCVSFPFPLLVNEKSLSHSHSPYRYWDPRTPTPFPHPLPPRHVHVEEYPSISTRMESSERYQYMSDDVNGTGNSDVTLSRSPLWRRRRTQVNGGIQINSYAHSSHGGNHSQQYMGNHHHHINNMTNNTNSPSVSTNDHPPLASSLGVSTHPSTLSSDHSCYITQDITILNSPISQSQSQSPSISYAQNVEGEEGKGTQRGRPSMSQSQSLTQTVGNDRSHLDDNDSSVISNTNPHGDLPSMGMREIATPSLHSFDFKLNESERSPSVLSSAPPSPKTPTATATTSIMESERRNNVRNVTPIPRRPLMPMNRPPHYHPHHVHSHSNSNSHHLPTITDSPHHSVHSIQSRQNIMTLTSAMEMTQEEKHRASKALSPSISMGIPSNTVMRPSSSATQDRSHIPSWLRGSTSILYSATQQSLIVPTQNQRGSDTKRAAALWRERSQSEDGVGQAAVNDENQH